MTNGSQVTHAISVCCLLHLHHYSERGTNPLVLKLVLGVPVAGDVKSCGWTRELPIANGRAVDWHPWARELSCALEREHHHASGMRVLTFPSLHHRWPFWYAPLQGGAGAPLPAVLCCLGRISWEHLAEYSQGTSMLALGKTPCAPVIVTYSGKTWRQHEVEEESVSCSFRNAWSQ